MSLFSALAARLIRIGERRLPDFTIGTAENPYLHRWYLIPHNRWLNIYLHQFLRSDDDRALHDHPWHNISVLLRGSYIDVNPSGPRLLSAGAIILRRATTRHRVKLLRPINIVDGKWSQAFHGAECWTLFITGPKIRDWGFWCPQGFVPWQIFTKPENTGEIGKGCAE